MRRQLVKVVLLLVALAGLTGMLLYKVRYEQMKIIVDGAGLGIVNKYFHLEYLVPASADQRAVAFGSQFDAPHVSWNNISDYFLFSAFRCRPSSRWEFGAEQQFCGLGFSPAAGGELPNLECSVWFDLGRELVSVAGALVVSKVGATDGGALQFKCALIELRPIHRSPYALVVKSPDHLQKLIVPIHVARPSPAGQSRVAACVYPDKVGSEWGVMAEFLAFHQTANFTDIIVYDSGINFGFLDKMKYLINNAKESHLSLSVLRWDFPFDSPAGNQLVELDCAYRTSGAANITAVVNWNQLLLPANGAKVQTLLSSLDPHKPTRSRLTAKRCCTDSADDRWAEESWPTILRKSVCVPHPEPNLLLTNPDGERTPVDSSEPTTAGLLTFASCHGLPHASPVPDFSMRKYSAALLGSNILKGWNLSKLFSIGVS